MLRYGRSSPGPLLGMGCVRLSRWRPAQAGRCNSCRYDHRGHGTVINQDGWYTFYVANRYTFKCRLTPRLDQGPVHREVLVGKKLRGTRLRKNLLEEFLL